LLEEALFNTMIDFINLDILAIIGLLITAAFLGSKIFQRLGIPQVVGFIVVGMLCGTSFLNIIPLELAHELTFVSHIALGLIGFDIGSHLRLRELRQLGRCLIIILICESIGTFLIVTAGIYAITQSIYTALIFGALASATAPAATVDVLAEYDAKGPLTTSILVVVGLDDALALILYSITANLAESALAGSGATSWESTALIPLIEIGGSILLGFGLGFILEWIMKHMKSHHDAMAISIAFVFLGVGLSETFGFSLILTSMLMGAFLVNRDLVYAQSIRYTIEQAGPVIYVLFFSLVGARFQIKLLPAMGLLGIAYILLRSIGKLSGAWIGGKLGKVESIVCNNLGFGLFSQAGVAIGLALASQQRFSTLGEEGETLGNLILNVITATTFVVQIIGPIFVKFAINRAGEIGQAKIEADPWASEGLPE
jgi:Kef-type K+ transport system membrane component KefB